MIAHQATNVFVFFHLISNFFKYVHGSYYIFKNISNFFRGNNIVTSRGFVDANYRKSIKSIAVDRQSKDLGSNPSAVESVIFSTERFSNSLNITY